MSLSFSSNTFSSNFFSYVAFCVHDLWEKTLKCILGRGECWMIASIECPIWWAWASADALCFSPHIGTYGSIQRGALVWILIHFQHAINALTGGQFNLSEHWWHVFKWFIPRVRMLKEMAPPESDFTLLIMFLLCCCVAQSIFCLTSSLII